MNNNYRDVFLKILDIVGYTEDKEVYAAEFFKTCFTKTTLEILENLPVDQKNKLNEDLKDKTKQEEIIAVINKYITTEAYSKYFQKVSQELMVEYLQSVIPSLDAPKADELDKYLMSLTNATPLK